MTPVARLDGALVGEAAFATAPGLAVEVVSASSSIRRDSGCGSVGRSNGSSPRTASTSLKKAQMRASCGDVLMHSRESLYAAIIFFQRTEHCVAVRSWPKCLRSFSESSSQSERLRFMVWNFTFMSLRKVIRALVSRADHGLRSVPIVYIACGRGARACAPRDASDGNARRSTRKVVNRYNERV